MSMGSATNGDAAGGNDLAAEVHLLFAARTAQQITLARRGIIGDQAQQMGFIGRCACVKPAGEPQSFRVRSWRA
jgi:hypothetical protein